MQWTTKQQAAIFGRAKNLLVSAAAGSGKTAVLVERVFERLNDSDHPADITEFLIVTFTNAAAAEMRVRLCKRISEALKTDPQNRHLRRQMQLVHSAHITTVHAFCLSLIRDHFHSLNLRPDFRLPGENEAELLLDEAAEEILTEEHDNRTSAFEALLAALADEKSDIRLKEHLKRAHIWFQSEPDGEGYIARCNAESTTAISADPAETVWGRRHLRTIAQTAKYALARYERMLELASRAEGNTEKVLATLETEQSAIAAIAKHAANGAWEQTARAVEAYCGQSTTLRFPKAFALDLAEAIKTQRNELKKKWKDHLPTDIVCEPIADTQAAFAEADTLQREFFRLVVRLDERFTQRKREANLLDFADLEHLAVCLLAQKGDDGEFCPTPLALEQSAAFREIMVDEYQDTNGLQDLIFRMLATKSSLFTVGDVKQSIYLFRRADPGIFLRRKNTYQPAPDVADEQAFTFPSAETAISLSDNFRSRREVLDSVNFVFSQLCSEEFGGLVYDDGEALHCGRADEDDARYTTEFDVLDLPKDLADGDDEEEDAFRAFSAAEIEAAHIARRIRKMLDEKFPVATKDGPRPCCCGDFAILLRSPKKRAAGLSRALRAQGIAVAADKNENFFASDEVNALLALLHTVDNPGSDLDLIGCLASPLVGFSYDELAQIRAANRRQGLFYDSLRTAAVGESPLAQKAADFLAWLARMRRDISDCTASEAVSHLLEETAAIAVYTATVGGEARRENILRILSLAQGYDKIGGFGEFVRYLDRLEEADNLSRPNTVDSTDSVKIMSIHASKGLEFPFVFLAGLSDKINVQWKSEALALHPTLGPGFKNRSRIAGGEMTT
ncbi:MAG: UvrD-helicase domain-containing protein, partial [Clostridia bacterium]|nr:UvrD-helicase domain-containing protein [Clostridia bacterium]